VVDLESNREGDFTPQIADVEGSFHSCAEFMRCRICSDPVLDIDPKWSP
jgi:hypothetical protein